MRIHNRSLVASVFVVLLALDPTRAVASVLTVTPGAIYQANDGVIYVDADVPSLVTGNINADFQAAFNSWNNEAGNPKGWTLVNGGALGNDTTFNVSLYRAHIDGGSGALEIQIDYTPGVGAPPAIANNNNIQPNEAVWSQSIFTSLKLAGSLPGNPYLDNPAGLANTQLGPPAYPFQYNGSFFYDDPHRPPTNFWYGVAYLSTADYTNKILTVYDGVAYGFRVGVVPEPSTLASAGVAALLGLGYSMRRRRSQTPS